MGGRLEFSEKLETRGRVSGQSVDHSADERGNGGETVSLLTHASLLSDSHTGLPEAITPSAAAVWVCKGRFLHCL